MRILFDVDGVMADFTPAFTKVAARQGKIPAPIESADQPDWHFDFPVDSVWDEIDNTYNWWMTLDPLVNEEEVWMVNKVAKEHGVLFITNRNKDGKGFPVATQTRLWLSCIGIDTRFVDVICTDDKAETAKKYEVDLAIDDKPNNIVALRDAGIKTIRRAWRYNNFMTGEWVPSVNEFIRQYVR